MELAVAIALFYVLTVSIAYAFALTVNSTNAPKLSKFAQRCSFARNEKWIVMESFASGFRSIKRKENFSEGRRLAAEWRVFASKSALHEIAALQARRSRHSSSRHYRLQVSNARCVSLYDWDATAPSSLCNCLLYASNVRCTYCGQKRSATFLPRSAHDSNASPKGKILPLSRFYTRSHVSFTFLRQRISRMENNREN